MIEVRVSQEPALSRAAADLLIAALPVDRPPVLGVATGSSPLGLYRELGVRVRAGSASFAEARAFMLDEYVGLPAGHPESYRAVVGREVGARLGIDDGSLHGPDGSAADLEAECARYERAIGDAGGVDMQVLGLGENGHIAFNEPGSPLESRTRPVELSLGTRRANARFFGGDVDAVPTHALTQGVATILGARQILVLAIGAAKAEAVRQLVEGTESLAWPATALHRHACVTLLVDPAAAALLGDSSPTSVH